MIPTIGVMIGAYIFTRMVELLTQKDKGVAVSFFAVVTLIVVTLGVFSLLAGSAVK